jgi:hypothetical protein
MSETKDHTPRAVKVCHRQLRGAQLAERLRTHTEALAGPG